MDVLVARFRRPNGKVIESRYPVTKDVALKDSLTLAVAKLRAENPGVRLLGITGSRIEFSVESNEC